MFATEVPRTCHSASSGPQVVWAVEGDNFCCMGLVGGVWDAWFGCCILWEPLILLKAFPGGWHCLTCISLCFKREKERRKRPSSSHIAQKDQSPCMRLGNLTAQGYKSIPKHADYFIFAYGILMADVTHSQWNVFSLLDVFAKKKALKPKRDRGKSASEVSISTLKIGKKLKKEKKSSLVTSII